MRIYYLALSFFFLFAGGFVGLQNTQAQIQLRDGLMDQHFTYIGLKHGVDVHSGPTRYFTYHYFDPQVFSQSHQHLFYRPFTASNEVVHSSELLLRLPLGNRMLVQAQLPYATKFRQEEDSDTLESKQSGLGDLSFDLGINYPLGQNGALVYLIGGASAPTGSFDRFDAAGEVEPHLQPGKGAWAVRGQLLAQGPWKGKIDSRFTWQWVADAVYQYHFKNLYSYQYGGAFRAQAGVSTKLLLGKGKSKAEQQQAALLPSFRLVYDRNGQDRMHEETIAEYTSVQLLRTELGLGYILTPSNKRSIRVNLYANYPIVQLNDFSLLDRKWQLGLGLFWGLDLREG